MISIVITTHGEGRDLPGILSSLEMQRQYRTGTSTKGKPFQYEAGDYFSKPDLEVIVSCDGSFRTIDIYSGVNRWIENDKADPPCCGHNTRQAGINSARGDWIVLTNSDNFFTHGWYHSVIENIVMHEVGMVYWDIVSNLWAWKARESKLAWGEIDLSCVCVRADIAKQVGFTWRNYDADWNYIECCSAICEQKKLRRVRIPEVLGVHN